MPTGRKTRRSAVLRVLLLLAMAAGALAAFSAVSAPASAHPSFNIMLKNVATGECLSRPEKTTNERLHLEPCGDSPRQRWERTCVDFFCAESRFVSLVDQKCVHGAGPEHKTFAGMYECSSIGSRDVWFVGGSSELGGFRADSRFYRDQCLDLLGGSDVGLSPCSLSPTQFWSIVYP